MTLAPLLAAEPVIQLHAFSAIAAFALGLVQLLAPKGKLPHRSLGFIWVALMVVVAGSSFFIHSIRSWGDWSPIHILSVVTLVALPGAVAHARNHRVASHKRAMTMIFAGALVIAGFFTFMPGRIMHEVAFGPDQTAGR